MDIIGRIQHNIDDARDFGFYWENIDMVLKQITNEFQEVKEEIVKNSNSKACQSEVGDLLLSVLDLCHYLNFDLEETLEQTNEKFANRMNLLKQIVESKGQKNLHGQSFAYKLGCWQEMKNLEEKTKSNI